MNFKELLQRPVEEVTSDFSILVGFYYNHVPESKLDLGFLDWTKMHNQERLKIHYLKNHCFDGRRVWQLYYITLDGELVMVCNNAGREGDDHADKAVMSKDRYWKMVDYLNTFSTEVYDLESPYIYSEDDEAGRFFSFYGNTLDSKFDISC